MKHRANLLTAISSKISWVLIHPAGSTLVYHDSQKVAAINSEATLVSNDRQIDLSRETSYHMNKLLSDIHRTLSSKSQAVKSNLKLTLRWP